MADIKISGLTAGTPTATDTFPFQRGGTANYQASGSAFGAGTILLPYVAPGTSGNVLTSDGTDWVSANPSGGTVLMSYVAPGTSGNVLTSDGTGWTSAAPTGGGGLEYSSIAPTTANITLEEAKGYIVDISGLTANRNLIIPVATEAGKEILITINVGDDTYSAIVIGDTTVTINNGTAATAYKTLKSAKQTIKMVSTSTNNWDVLYIHEGYGTPTGKLQAYKNAGDQAFTAVSGWTKVTLDSETVDQLGQWNTSTSIFTAMSSGLYLVTFSCALNHGSALDNVGVSTRIYGTLLGTGASSATIVSQTHGSTQYYDAIATIQVPLLAGDSFETQLLCTQNTTIRNTITRTHLEVVKICD